MNDRTINKYEASASLLASVNVANATTESINGTPRPAFFWKLLVTQDENQDPLESAW